MNSNIKEVDSFFKLYNLNCLFYYSSNVTRIFLESYNLKVSMVDCYDYIRMFILSTNIFDLCCPIFIIDIVGSIIKIVLLNIDGRGDIFSTALATSLLL